MGKCKDCRYHDDFSAACYNGDSEHRGDFTDNEFSCDEFAPWSDSDEQLMDGVKRIGDELHEISKQLRRLNEKRRV